MTVGDRVLPNGPRLRWRGLRLFLFLAVLAPTACSGGAESAGDGSSAGGEPTLATVEVITEAATVRRGGVSDVVPARDGDSLAQGDQLSTDATGSAEVVFFDGSWQRIDHDTTLTLTELVDIEGGRVVHTGIDGGRAWQRVRALTTDEEVVEVDTPVAVATVRGTAFSIECTTDPVACSFAVVEGAVALTFANAGETTLRAGQRLTVRRDEPPGVPEDVGMAALQQDPWIADNLARDAADPPTPPPGGGVVVTPLDPELVEAAEALCVEAGAQSEVVATSGIGSDDVARQQADILDATLDQLATLEPPPEAADRFAAMIDDYRRRTQLVRAALAAPPDERAALVSQLLAATAAGAAQARALGLDDCVIRPR